MCRLTFASGAAAASVQLLNCATPERDLIVIDEVLAASAAAAAREDDTRQSVC